MTRVPRAKLWPVLLIVLLAGLLANAPAAAQVTLLEPEKRAPAQVPDDYLTLTGRSSAVRFLPGGLDRAHHVLQRIDLLSQQLNRWSDVPSPILTYLVDRARWTELDLPGIYGIPLRAGPTAVAAPIEGDEQTVALWRELLGAEQVPMIPGVPLRGTPEQAGTLAIADVLLQLETARGFVQRAGLLGDRAWIGEVVAQTASLSLFLINEHERVTEIEAFFARLRERLGGAGAYPESAYTPALATGGRQEMERWLWYQATFFEAARRLVARHGKKAIPKLRRLAKKAPPLREAVLMAEYDELRAWRAESFAP